MLVASGVDVKGLVLVASVVDMNGLVLVASGVDVKGLVPVVSRVDVIHVNRLVFITSELGVATRTDCRRTSYNFWG